ERDSEGLFRNAAIYLSEIENRYLSGEARRKVIHGLYKLPLVKTDNPRVLLKDGEIVHIGDIRIECLLVPGHTWGHMVYLVDDEYLFTGDTIWFGADGGYSFLPPWPRTTSWRSGPWKRWNRSSGPGSGNSRSSPDTRAGRTSWASRSCIEQNYVNRLQRNTSIPPRPTTATWRTTIQRRACGPCPSERWEQNET
ncbi:MAG: MBL fold metallo-hydrolase, partial [Oscillospiraceae bacterium]|nr:MBL fold metallo-hydrolase [Oscillospiraceae bacterium]